MGFDTLAAQMVLKLKEIYPHIKLILVFPCISQTRGWSETDKNIYEMIKKKADKYYIMPRPEV
ncbi:MAG: SLOG family protein [Lachnospiraceae bacterium]